MRFGRAVAHTNEGMKENVKLEIVLEMRLKWRSKLGKFLYMIVYSRTITKSR